MDKKILEFNLKDINRSVKKVLLGDIVKSIKGKKPKNLSSKKSEKFSLPYVNIQAFEKGIVNEYTDGEGCVICEEGDFLMVWDGSRSGMVGKAIKGALGSTLVKLTFPNMDNDYAFYFLQSKFAEINTRAKGVGIPHVDPNLLWNYELRIPPLKEQQAIVSKIEELFIELDKGIESLKTALEQLKIYRQAVLKWAFEGRLTEDWRRNKKFNSGALVVKEIFKYRNEALKNPSLRISSESNRIQNKIAKHKFTQPENKILPNEWSWTSLLEACFLVVDCHNKTAPYIDSGIYLIRTTNIKNGTLILDENIKYVSDDTYQYWSRRCPPASGDILFTREAPMGESAIIPPNTKVCMGQRIMLLRTFPHLLLTKYLHYAMQEPSFQKRMNNSAIGTGVKHLRVGDVEQLVFPICSTEEQKQIVFEIETRLSVADKMESSINESLLQSETLRQSILKQAFEGRLVTMVQEAEQREFKPKNSYFFQMQLLGIIAKTSKEKKIEHGEMTLAKYTYLADKLYQIPTQYNFQRWHLGPYPPEIKKAINNKQYFKRSGNNIEVINEKTLLKSTNPFQDQIINAVTNLADIFAKYSPKGRAHKTELLATVCKVIEDIQSTEITDVRNSMQEWEIDLKSSKYKNKAEKFDKKETADCIQFIVKNGWHKSLLG